MSHYSLPQPVNYKLTSAESIPKDYTGKNILEQLSKSFPHHQSATQRIASLKPEAKSQKPESTAPESRLLSSIKSQTATKYFIKHSPILESRDDATVSLSLINPRTTLSSSSTISIPDIRHSRPHHQPLTHALRLPLSSRSSLPHYHIIHIRRCVPQRSRRACLRGWRMSRCICCYDDEEEVV